MSSLYTGGVNSLELRQYKRQTEKFLKLKWEFSQVLKLWITFLIHYKRSSENLLRPKWEVRKEAESISGHFWVFIIWTNVAERIIWSTMANFLISGNAMTHSMHTWTVFVWSTNICKLCTACDTHNLLETISLTKLSLPIDLHRNEHAPFILVLFSTVI